MRRLRPRGALNPVLPVYEKHNAKNYILKLKIGNFEAKLASRRSNQRRQTCHRVFWQKIGVINKNELTHHRNQLENINAEAVDFMADKTLSAI